jgi:hypothetical protein
MDAIVVILVTIILLEAMISPRIQFTRNRDVLLFYTNPKTGSRDYKRLFGI